MQEVVLTQSQEDPNTLNMQLYFQATRKQMEALEYRDDETTTEI